MTEILIIQGHPDAAEPHLCHAIAQAYRAGAEAAGHRVNVIDIAQQDVPFLRSQAQWEGPDWPPICAPAQAAILAAEHLVLVYPLWMGDVPALLKAWIEQVFRKGFAFEMRTPDQLRQVLEVARCPLFVFGAAGSGDQLEHSTQIPPSRDRP